MYERACRIDSHRDLIHRYIQLQLELSDPRKFYFSNATLLSVILTRSGNVCPKITAKILRSKCWRSAGYVYLHPEYQTSSSTEIGDLNQLGKFDLRALQWLLCEEKLLAADEDPNKVCPGHHAMHSLANVCQGNSLHHYLKSRRHNTCHPLSLTVERHFSLFFLWFLYGLFWFTLDRKN